MTLTKDDVTAMRQANGFVIHGAGDLAKIRCIKRIPSRTAGPFGSNETELEHEIPDIPCQISMSAGALFQRQRGSRAISSRSYCDNGAWQALALLARAGDALEVRFSENGNQYVHGVTAGDASTDAEQPHRFYDLHHDECQATLYRTNKYGMQKTVIDRLVLDSSTCPNNSARMIQY